MEIVDKIFSVLDEKNYSQQFLADALGIDKSTLSAWKSGKTKSYMKYIDKICQLLDVSREWLMGKSKERESYAPVSKEDKRKANNILHDLLLKTSKKEDMIEVLELDEATRSRIKSNIVYFAAKEGDTFVTSLKKIKVSSSFGDSLTQGGAVLLKDVSAVAKHYNVIFNLFVQCDLTFETGRNIARLMQEKPFDREKIKEFMEVDVYINMLSQGYCPSPLQLELIAEAFGVDIIDLPIPYNELCRILPFSIAGISEEEIAGLRAVRKLNDKGKKLIANYLDDIAAVYSEEQA